jgi:hypothetical protein
MEYVVYCDESRHDGSSRNPYMAIGGLWVRREEKEALSRRFRDLRREVGLRAEIKWSKVSRGRLDAYKQLVDFFFAEEAFRFRVIVVDQAKMDLEKFHGGDRELGFYKFYYEMLEKWLEPGNEYLILLDFKQNKGADRYKTLRTILERKVKGKAWITDLTVIDSGHSPLAQLCDMLTGAVASAWCDSLPAGRPKTELADYIAGKCGWTSLKVESPLPAASKMNVFRIRLS